jgi:hypothetical protein
LLDGLSEQPAGHSASVSDLRHGVVSGVVISVVNKLLVIKRNGPGDLNKPLSGRSAAVDGHDISPYVLCGLRINRANQVWALDTTYIPIARGVVCLIAVVN